MIARPCPFPPQAARFSDTCVRGNRIADSLHRDGALMPAAGTQPLDEPAVERLVFQILDEDQRQILLKDKEFDFSFAFGTLGRFRVNAFHERGNLASQYVNS